MTTLAKHRSLPALLLVLALIAAACSGTQATVSTEAATAADDTTAQDAPAADDEEAEAIADDEPATDEPADTVADAETSAPLSGPPPSLPPEEAAAAAEQNIPNLQTSDDVRDIEVVSVYDGSITSLREVVTGDRPVLVWFWAPH
jgi:hypothetical protein